jgi:hypothetical protein
MPKFLNNIDLNGNQLLSPVIHVSSQSTDTNGPAGNTTGTEGQIFYNSHAKALYFRDDTAWRPVGDISGVSAGVGLSGGGTGGNVTLTIDFSEFSDVTPANGDKLATLDSDGSTEQLTTIASLATLFAGSGLTATNSVIAVDTLNQNTTGSAGSVANALTVDDTTVKLSSGTTYNGSSALTLSAKTATIADGGAGLATADQIHTFVTTQTDSIAASTTGNAATVTTNANLSGHITSSGNTTSLGSFTTAQLNAAISDGSINSQTLPTDFVSAANGGTFSGNVNLGDNDITNVGIIYLDEIKADTNASSITIGNEASKQVNLGKANTVDGNGDPTDPSVETPVVVRGSLNVNGKLTVAGDFETTSTSNTIIKDKIIQLNSGATGANSADFGFVFNRGSETNVAFRWDESELNFDLIATASSADSGTINPYDPNSNGESSQGATNWQNFRAAGISAITGFSGPGSGITSLNGTNISSGTVAAARVASLATSKITSGTFANARISSGSVTQHEANIDHDALTNFSSDEHFTQANITTVGTIGTGTWQGSVIASAYLDSDTAHLTGAQTFSGVKTFSGGLVLDDGTTAAPIIKWINEDDDEFTIFNNASGKLKFQQKLVGGTATNQATLDENGLDVDSGLSINGSAVHPTDTTTTLGTSDTVVPSQNAVKTYVDSQSSSSGNTGGRNAFVLNDTSTGVAVSNSNKTYTITHGMGASLNYGVEVIRGVNGSGETVYTDVTRTTTTIVINFAVAPTAGDYTALVCKY